MFSRLLAPVGRAAPPTHPAATPGPYLDPHLELYLPLLGTPFLFALISILLYLGYLVHGLWTSTTSSEGPSHFGTLATEWARVPLVQLAEALSIAFGTFTVAVLWVFVGSWWILTVGAEIALVLCAFVVPANYARRSLVHSVGPNRMTKIHLLFLYQLVFVRILSRLLGHIPIPSVNGTPISWIKVEPMHWRPTLNHGYIYAAIDSFILATWRRSAGIGDGMPPWTWIDRLRQWNERNRTIHL
ncbi:hypothetical protein RQP46_003366 [Phenoliferia psychrophenolica]